MTQWLPLLSSIIVASAALVGVVINNRTNRQAIVAADERNQVTLEAAQTNIELANLAAEAREHEKWRRETLLATVTDVLRRSGAVRQRLRGHTNWQRDALPEIDGEISAMILDLDGTVSALSIVSKGRIPDLTRDLVVSLYGALLSSLEHANALLSDVSTKQEQQQAKADWARKMAFIVDVEKLIITAARDELGIEPNVVMTDAEGNVVGRLGDPGVELPEPA